MNKQTAKLNKLLKSREPSYIGNGIDITVTYPDGTGINMMTDRGTINIYDDLNLIVYENIANTDSDMPVLLKSMYKLFKIYESNYQHTGSFDPSQSSDIKISIPKKTYCYDNRGINWLLFSNGDTWNAYQFKYDSPVTEIGEVHF